MSKYVTSIPFSLFQQYMLVLSFVKETIMEKSRNGSCILYGPQALISDLNEVLLDSEKWGHMNIS